MELIVDAKGMVAGRLASLVAKELLKGQRVKVVNAEQIVISGNPGFTEKAYKEKVKRGDPYHGPHYPRGPNLILKRIIRGMLPYKKPKGREALKRLRVYVSIPKELEGKELKRFKQAEDRLKCPVTRLGKLSSKLGAKKRW